MNAIHDYLRTVARVHAAGDATEHTYRPALRRLVESCGENVQAVNEPRCIQCGAPDFIVNVSDAPVGYIECKELGAPLDAVEATDQLQRYFKSLPNLIRTDYLEFRYYRDGASGAEELSAAVPGSGPGGRYPNPTAAFAGELETRLQLKFIPAAGDNVVAKPRYMHPGKGSKGRVYIDKDQYFDNVPPQAWEFHVGGYQVCEKWLKDRKERTLSFDEIETYRRSSEALREPLRLMDAVDQAIPAWPIT